MGAWIWIGFAAFFVVALVVGVRVLLLARRTRELPELLMGVGVLGIGPVGFGLLVLGQQLQASHPLAFQVMVGTASFAISCGARGSRPAFHRSPRPTRSRRDRLARHSRE